MIKIGKGSSCGYNKMAGQKLKYLGFLRKSIILLSIFKNPQDQKKNFGVEASSGITLHYNNYYSIPVTNRAI